MSTQESLSHLLLALAVIILMARAVGIVFRKIGQPPVMGEVIAGILLGPSFLGRLSPSLFAYLLPASVAPQLSGIAQVGVILYMFVIGMELDTHMLVKQSRAAIVISQVSIAIPFGLGMVLAFWLFPNYSGEHVSFWNFALFMGVAMSITAFPVLARILSDLKMAQSSLGALALACAAVDDVSAWCLLAFVVGLTRAQANVLPMTMGLCGVFIILMICVVRPLLLRMVRRHKIVGHLDNTTLALMCSGVLVSAFVTEIIGIHALFGAFMLGAIMPHDSDLVRQLRAKLEDLVVAFMLPAFFALTGMRTHFETVSSVGVCCAIILVASVGKFGGATLAARATGLEWRPAAALGVLMNTRGLMELIVLNVGLDLGVLSPALFAMMVMMAVVTTLCTSPVLARLLKGAVF